MSCSKTLQNLKIPIPAEFEHPPKVDMTTGFYPCGKKVFNNGKEESFLQCISTDDAKIHAINDKAVDSARKGLIEIIKKHNLAIEKK